MRRRELLWTLFGLVIVLAPLLSEGMYRHSVRRQAADLADQILARHPHWERIPPVFCRFGASTDQPEPSLFGDLRAWAALKLGWTSGLNHDRCCTLHAYLMVQFESQKEADKECHPFIWSPRRHRFVVFDDGSHCRMPGCAWAAEIAGK